MTQWLGALAELETRSGETGIVRRRPMFPHPMDAGARPSTSLPRGQDAVFRFPPDSPLCGLLVLQYQDYWLILWDDHSTPNPQERVRIDSAVPQGVVGGAALGTALGVALSGTRRAAMLGAVLGGVAGYAAAVHVNKKVRQDDE